MHSPWIDRAVDLKPQEPQGIASAESPQTDRPLWPAIAIPLVIFVAVLLLVLL